MPEELKLTEAGICTALIDTCIKAMNTIRPGEQSLSFTVRCKSIRSKTPERINETLRQEAIIEEHPDGSITIRAGNTFAVAVPEGGRWKVQEFYLWVEPHGFHAIHIETRPLTSVGFLPGPLQESPERELARILSLFSLI